MTHFPKFPTISWYFVFNISSFGCSLILPSSQWESVHQWVQCHRFFTAVCDPYSRSIHMCDEYQENSMLTRNVRVIFSKWETAKEMCQNEHKKIICHEQSSFPREGWSRAGGYSSSTVLKAQATHEWSTCKSQWLPLFISPVQIRAYPL